MDGDFPRFSGTMCLPAPLLHTGHGLPWNIKGSMSAEEEEGASVEKRGGFKVQVTCSTPAAKNHNFRGQHSSPSANMTIRNIINTYKALCSYDRDHVNINISSTSLRPPDSWTKTSRYRLWAPGGSPVLLLKVIASTSTGGFGSVASPLRAGSRSVFEVVISFARLRFFAKKVRLGSFRGSSSSDFETGQSWNNIVFSDYESMIPVRKLMYNS